MDGGEQLVLHHLPHGRQGHMRRIRAAVGGREVAHHSTEGLTKAVCHMQGDVVDARACVVMSRCAACHAVDGRVPLFHFLFPAGEPLGTLFILSIVSFG